MGKNAVSLVLLIAFVGAVILIRSLRDGAENGPHEGSAHEAVAVGQDRSESEETSRVPVNDPEAAAKNPDMEAPAAANNGIGVAAGDIETYLKKTYPAGEWNILRGENGRPSSLLGSVPGKGRSIGEAEAFAREIATALGIPPEQLQRAKEQPRAGAGSRAFGFDQIHEGLEVYGSGIQVFARNADGTVFMVNTSLKDIGPYNPRPVFSRAEVEKTLTAHYHAESIKLHKGPLLWAPSRDDTQLAWIFEVEARNPKYDVLLVTVSAESGKILADQSMHVH